MASPGALQTSSPAPPAAQLSHPAYRPDIDGLRALAVLSVLVYHAFPTRLKGGFVGVDIFFVISGYLISTIIFNNLERGSFSFREFYARRVRRIFPALLVVLLASMVFGWLALLADEFAQLGRHILAGTAFVSNLVLWSESGYFDKAAETKPLLHLWSLGIEEQFYIAWPLIAWLAWRSRFGLLLITLAVLLGSFGLNLHTLGKDAAASFYSPLTRFWELSVGSLLAYLVAHRHLDASRLAPRMGNLLSLLGVASILFALCFTTQDYAFPGWWAVPPVLGAALLITAGSRGWLNRQVFSNKVAVWFGLISFPLYLWHWPLLSFARVIEGVTPEWRFRLAALLAAILLAWLTYRFVEKPLRSGKVWPGQARVLAGAMLIQSLLGALILQAQGFPQRLPASDGPRNTSAIEWTGEDDARQHEDCMRKYRLAGFIRYCKLSSSDGQPSIALIGDSHASSLFVGMAEALGERKKPLLNIGGRLFVDVATYPRGDEFEIEVYKGGIRATEFVAQEASIDTVVMVSGARSDFLPASDSVFHLISDPSITDRKKVWEIGLRKTLDKFVGVKKRVVFVIDNPHLDFDPSSCVDRPLRLSKKIDRPCGVARAAYEQQFGEYRALVFEVLKDYPSVKIFDVAAVLCDAEWCWAKSRDGILYVDRTHLSVAGSRVVGRALVKYLEQESF